MYNNKQTTKEISLHCTIIYTVKRISVVIKCFVICNTLQTGSVRSTMDFSFTAFCKARLQPVRHIDLNYYAYHRLCHKYTVGHIKSAIWLIRSAVGHVNIIFLMNNLKSPVCRANRICEPIPKSIFFLKDVRSG